MCGSEEDAGDPCPYQGLAGSLGMISAWEIQGGLPRGI